METRGEFEGYYRAHSRIGEALLLRIFAFALLIGLAFLAGGCSLTLPFSSKAAADDEPQAALVTGALPSPRPLIGLPADLGPEDLRRAIGAMGLALDPQGNGAPVAWNNPESGMRGQFSPVGGPFLKNDEICRAFIVSTTLQTGQVWQQGTACRLSGGEWSFKDLQAFRKL